MEIDDSTRHGLYAVPMLRYNRQFRNLALAYAALAGFVDTIGFLKSGGLFVSFMSGNSTRLAIGVAEQEKAGLAALGLIALFVLGVVLGALLGVSVPGKHRKFTAAASVAVLLVLAAGLQSLLGALPAIAALCVAMGASNTIFQRDGDVSIGLTYMTGTLVKLGHRIADALRGGDKAAWLPYLLLWLSLVSGGIAGAFGYTWSPNYSLWVAAGFAVSLALAVRFLTAERA